MSKKGGLVEGIAIVILIISMFTFLLLIMLFLTQEEIPISRYSCFEMKQGILDDYCLEERVSTIFPGMVYSCFSSDYLLKHYAIFCKNE